MRSSGEKGSSTSRGAQLRQQVEEAQNLRAIANHLPIAHLPPAQHAVAVHDEGGAPGHVTSFIEDAISADNGAMDVAQQREGESLSLSIGSVRKGTVGADS
jgi:hypothetical protein